MDRLAEQRLLRRVHDNLANARRLTLQANDLMAELGDSDHDRSVCRGIASYLKTVNSRICRRWKMRREGYPRARKSGAVESAIKGPRSHGGHGERAERSA